MIRLTNPYENSGSHHCFACSPKNRDGLKMEFFEDGDFIISKWKPKDAFEGFKNILHGGIQATMLDEIASWVVQLKLKTAGVTMGIELKYRKPVFIADNELTVKGKVKNVEKRIATIDTGLYNKNGELCTAALVKYYIYPEEEAREKFGFPGAEKFNL